MSSQGSFERQLGVPDGQHICLLYGAEEEQLRTIAQFFAAARSGGHKLVYITDANPVEVVRQRFAGEGIDLRPESGAEVQTTQEAYHPEGRFEPEVMCDRLEALAARARAEGFAGCRCTGEMGWATRNVPGSERLIEYEVMLTEVIERQPFSGICQYDVRLFDGATLFAVLEVHPYLLVRGRVVRNPNFVRRTVPRRGGQPAGAADAPPSV